jgi:hypothetical protein
MSRDAKIGHGTGAVNRPRVSAGRRSGEPPDACRPCLRLLWKCAECACLGIRNSTLARAHLASYVVVAKPRTDHFRRGETRPIARPVRIAVAPRCAVQEVDPRFSRLAALTLVNRMAASHPGMEAGAPEAKPQTLQFRRRLREEERGSESPTPGNQRVGRPAFPFGDCGPSLLWLCRVPQPATAKSPPTSPHHHRNAIPASSSPGVTRKVNAISLKLAQSGHTFEPCLATTKRLPARSPPRVPGS